jgi:putative transposase
VYPVIAALEQEGLDVRCACEALRVSRSGYYRFQQGAVGARQREDERLQALVQEAFTTHRRRYGTRRIAKDLAARGECCGRGRTRKIMGQMGLVAIQPRSFKPRTTASRHTLGYNDNLLLDAPSPNCLNQVWVGDITYLPLPRSFAYLAVLMDLYSRKIIGWTVRDHLRESLVLAALQQAIRERQPTPELIHHTDRGGQYASHQYREVLRRAKMRQSMSRPDNPYDNAVMESCFGKLKTELEMTYFENVHVAEKEIREYIQYYNQRRRHSAIKYLSPNQFEIQLGRP